MSYSDGSGKLSFILKSNPGLFKDGAVNFSNNIENEMSVTPDVAPIVAPGLHA